MVMTVSPTASRTGVDGDPPFTVTRAFPSLGVAFTVISVTSCATDAV